VDSLSCETAGAVEAQAAIAAYAAARGLPDAVLAGK
jgi:hypothetical protein